MNTQKLRKGFGTANGRENQVAAYHIACGKAADEIDRLRRIIDVRQDSMEPQVLFAGVRDREDDQGFPVFDIECRFSDGQKFAAVQVDGLFPELAMRIAEFLSWQTN